MRVIAGKARSIPLKAPKGLDTRPTTDRIKETLFNMLQSRVGQARFLDLFAGSGAIGIEALSRGAAYCVFVEQNRNTASVIRENLQKTKLTEDSRILVMDVLAAIRHLEGQMPFDCIFLDPPYKGEMEEEVLRALSDSDIISGDSLIIVEAGKETDFSFLDNLPFEIVKDKQYKTNRHLFLKYNKTIKESILT